MCVEHVVPLGGKVYVHNHPTNIEAEYGFLKKKKSFFYTHWCNDIILTCLCRYKTMII